MTRDEAIKIANKTCRSKGAVGSDPLCYRYVRTNCNKQSRILDYGAGKDAKHSIELRQHGFEKVIAYDVGENFDATIHTGSPEDSAYDIVIASNVLNVLPDMSFLCDTIKELYSFAKKEQGIIVFNYPSSPRKLGLSINQIITAFLVLTGLRPHKVTDSVYVLDLNGGKHGD